MSPIARRTALFFSIVVGPLLFAVPGDATPTPVGNTTVVVRTVTGTLETVVRRLVVKDSVSQDEVIATSAEGASKIVFKDGTQLTLGPHAQVTLDKFIYDSDPTRGAFFLTLAEGVLRFVSGTLAHQAYSIKTPNGTIGVRGTDIYMSVQCEVVDNARACSTMLGSFSGVATFTDPNGTRVVAPGQFMSAGAASAGGSQPGTLEAAVLAQVTSMLAQISFAESITAGAGAGAGILGADPAPLPIVGPFSVSPTTP